MKNDPKLAQNQLIGPILKKRRQSLKLSLTDVELATKIRGKFLIALENSDYDSISHDVYTKGFVQSYADFLGLNGRVISSQYLVERGDLPDERPKSIQPPTKSFVITPRLVIVSAAVLILAAVMAYFGWQVSTLAAAPKLVVTNPSSDQVIEGSLADVNGHATLGADVFVNDSPVLTDTNGAFAEKVALQDGVNTIRVMAKNKLGKTTVVTRSILAKIPKPLGAQTSEPATIDGVRVDISIKATAAAITVLVDDKLVFQGTMLAGTTQTFSGNQRVVITTSNAGQTALKVTNSVVAAKSIDPVGKDGEIKRDLEFTKDTVIP
ncbi:MAG TPA: RodZ domain-containing protein [Candidatus Saccharimonadales bacterium]|nr:RodZ domain-containing protein [Candidatus Saccharimonadales bacterium]